MIPIQLKSISGALEVLFSYGPPLVLVAVGVWIIWTGLRSPSDKPKSDTATDQSEIDLVSGTSGWQIRIEPMIAPSAVSSELSQKEGAFIALTNDGVPSIEESHNVTSYVDTGHNQFTVNFDTEIDPKRIVCTPVGTTPRDFEVKRATPFSVDIEFKGPDEPAIVALWFHEANVPSNSSNDPDLTIGELFRGLLPHPVEDAPDWLTVGNEVRDKASLGQVHIWGRPARYWDYPEQARIAAVAAPLEPIGPSYWRDAQFNWGTVFEPDTHLPHTVPIPHKFMTEFQRYNGLRVNRKEALDIWPERLKPLIPPASSGFSI